MRVNLGGMDLLKNKIMGLVSRPMDIPVLCMPICIVALFITLFLHSGLISVTMQSWLVSLEYTLGYVPCTTPYSMIPSIINKFFFIFALLCVCGSYILSYEKIKFFRRLAYKKIILVLFFSLLVCTSLIPLFSSWSLATPAVNTLAGLMPFWDAWAYYTGADNLLHNGILNSWNERRPINAILFATRLILTGLDFKNALILQSLLFGVSSALASIIIVRKFGWGCGFLFYGVIFSYANYHLPTTLSETLGLSLGCLSFVFLIGSLESQEIKWFFSGCFMLGLALLSRSGAMLVIPMVIATTGIIFMKKDQISWKSIIYISLAFICAFTLNSFILNMYGTGEGTSNSNFANTIYGLSVGSNWQQAEKDFPFNGLTPKKWSEKVYSRSLKNIVKNPEIFFDEAVKRYVQYGDQFFLNIFINYFAILGPYPPKDLINSVWFTLFIFMMFVGATRHIYLHKLQDKYWFFIIAVMGGLILSFPIMFDADLRALSPVVPFIAGMIIIMISGLMRESKEFEAGLNNKQTGILVIAFIILIGIIFSLLLTPLFGPNITSSILNLPSGIDEPLSCPNGTTKMLIRIDPGAPQLIIISDAFPNRTFLPIVATNNFDTKCYGGFGGPKDWFPKVEPGFGLILSRDYIGNQNIMLKVPIDFLQYKYKWVNICAVSIPDTWGAWDMCDYSLVP